MNEVAIDRAVWAGFRLVAKAPRAFLLWILVYVVLGLGPIIGIYAAIGPEYIELMRSSFSTNGQPDPTQMTALMSQMQGMQGLSLLASLAVFAVLYAAIFRAVLEPENKRFGYLRLGADEFRQAALIATFYVGFVIIITVMAIVVVLLVAGVGVGAGSMAAGAVLGVVGFFALAGVTIWLLARLSMVLPMTFAEKRFRFEQAWTLTRGHTGKLILVTLILFLVVLVMSLLMMAIYGVAIVALFASLGDSEAITAYFNRPAQALFRDLTPLGLGIALISSLLSTLFMVVMAAPWAVIYRQLAGDRQATEDVFA